MQIKTSVLAAVAALTVGAGLAFTAAPALAQAPLKDGAYLSVARCAGLVEGLGADPAAYDKLLEDQHLGRDPVVTDQAGTMRSDTARAARHATGQRKARFEADRDGVCKSFVS